MYTLIGGGDKFISSKIKTKGLASEVLEDGVGEDKRMQPVTIEGKLLAGSAREEVVSKYKNTVMYISSALASLYAEPKKDFDNRLDRLPYGTMVTVTSKQGKWAKVTVGEVSGWLMETGLVNKQTRVHPKFVDGKVNSANHLNTVQLRAIINDAFMAGELGHPLTAPEYIVYRLIKRNKAIKWPPERPRLAGRWHRILKGRNGIHIGIEPKTDAIMEYTGEDGSGHLSYIDGYFSDGTIVCSGVIDRDGTYKNQILTKPDWLELKPLFITVS